MQQYAAPLIAQYLSSFVTMLPMTELLRRPRPTLCILLLLACGSVRPSENGLNDGGMDGAAADTISDTSTMAEFASCNGLSNICGADGKDNCCNSLMVPGGTYYRSFDLANDGNSGSTSFPATISDFRLDKYEVTVGRFREFAARGTNTQSNSPNKGAGAHPGIVASGWDPDWNGSLATNVGTLVGAIKCDSTVQTWTDEPGLNENRPINCVSWYDAMAYCAWDGGYLPTEAEWNYAAAGGNQQRAYPWSNPAGSLILDNAHSSYFDGMNCLGDGMAGCALTDVVAVGTKPAGDGRWGHSDLAGNVFEWTLDWSAAYPSNCVDCANLATTTKKELRGGSFATDNLSLRAGSRLGLPSSNRAGIGGFRCARPALR